MRQYLNREQIIQLQAEAKSLLWKRGILANIDSHWSSLLSVSPLGLIYFKGNSDTGFQHIRERHGYYSEKEYFGVGALGNPSKFKSTSKGLLDYREIADKVYQQGTKDIKSHIDEELFDKYVAYVNTIQENVEIQMKYYLILYKNSKVVHSLYPHKSIDNIPKKVLKNYVRDRSEITLNLCLGKDYRIIKIPYVNERNVPRYVVIFKINESNLRVDFHLQVNFISGKPFMTIMRLFDFSLGLNQEDLNFDTFTKIVEGVSVMDMTLFEKEILSIDNMFRKSISDSH